MQAQQAILPGMMSSVNAVVGRVTSAFARLLARPDRIGGLLEWWRDAWRQEDDHDEVG